MRVRECDVLLVEDDEMPAGKNWLLIEHSGGVLMVLSRSTAGDPRSIRERLTAYGQLIERRSQQVLRAS